ncbi:MAG: tRNA lysidine(34) synthetase TilS [Candidatus Binatia bacterium]
MPLESKIKGTIARYGLVAGGDRLLLGVSGGPDSVALLHCLCALKNDLDFEIEVAHVIHGIRGEEGRRDAEFVAALTESLGLGFHLHEVDLPRRKMERGKGNIEALGREERYRFFAAAAERSGCGKVATAHTRDDQVETALMWLLRGGGRKGLGGMPPSRPLSAGRGVKLIRPLIDCSKAEVLGYLEDNGIEYKTDATNWDAVPLRNWIRLQLLPQLRERIDSRLDERLAHLADIFREEDRILDGLASEILKTSVQSGGMPRDVLLRIEKGMRRRVLRLWIEDVTGGLRGLSFDQVEACLKLGLNGPPQGRVSLGRGWEMVRGYENLRLRKGSVKQSGQLCYTYHFRVGGELLVPEAGVRIRSSLHSQWSQASPVEESEAVFDLRCLSPTLTVRNFRAGDRFRPLGMAGRKKVKDLFIDKKAPSAVRRALPLLLSGEEILWIPGYGRSDVAKVNPGTKEILKVELDFGG